MAFNECSCFNPALPYKNLISGGLQPGRAITIQGIFHPKGNWFLVNLRHLHGIALHYNTRLCENTVVRNSLLDGQWGTEERGGALPFQKGQPFTLTIICEESSFRILVNKMLAHSFTHRFFPLHNINILEIDGDIQLTSVSF